MIGKIVQVVSKSLSEGFEVTYGLESSDLNIGYRVAFGEIKFNDQSPIATKTYINGGYLFTKEIDGFKEMLIFNKTLPEDSKEETLLVIVPYAATIKTSAKKVAGRYPCEAILEMNPGDTLEVSASYNSEILNYMVVEAGNELFLVQKNR